MGFTTTIFTLIHSVLAAIIGLGVAASVSPTLGLAIGMLVFIGLSVHNWDSAKAEAAAEADQKNLYATIAEMEGDASKNVQSAEQFSEVAITAFNSGDRETGHRELSKVFYHAEQAYLCSQIARTQFGDRMALRAMFAYLKALESRREAKVTDAHPATSEQSSDGLLATP